MEGSNNLPKTGSELVAYWQSEGLIGTRTDITDSQRHARQLRRQAEKRARKQHTRLGFDMVFSGEDTQKGTTKGPGE
jgi:hypothetical protein